MGNTWTVEKEDKYKGYDYAVIAQSAGHRCGYVKVPSNHILYKRSYSDPISTIGKDRRALNNKKIGKRGYIDIFCITFGGSQNLRIGYLFDVHGGITFSDKSYWGKRGWWFGFDCSHSGDAKDFSIMTEKYKERYKNFPVFEDDVLRTKGYVEQECKNLINQLIKLSK